MVACSLLRSPLPFVGDRTVYFDHPFLLQPRFWQDRLFGRWKRSEGLGHVAPQLMAKYQGRWAAEAYPLRKEKQSVLPSSYCFRLFLNRFRLLLFSACRCRCCCCTCHTCHVRPSLGLILVLVLLPVLIVTIVIVVSVTARPLLYGRHHRCHCRRIRSEGAHGFESKKVEL